MRNHGRSAELHTGGAVVSPRFLATTYRGCCLYKIRREPLSRRVHGSKEGTKVASSRRVSGCDLVPTKSYSNSSTRAPGAPASRLIWSRATRRDVRRHTAQASELNLHSFRVHIDGSVTWRSLSLHRTSLHQICRRDRQLHTIPDCEKCTVNNRASRLATPLAHRCSFNSHHVLLVESDR